MQLKSNTSKLHNNKSLINPLILFLFLVSGYFVNGQINGTSPPFVLTIDELKEWTSDGPTAEPANISTVPLANRFIQTDTQIDPALSNDMKIMWAPDGMSSLANYIEEQPDFNLYNLTHWSYIDKIIWFGGPLLIPSKPWVDTAHKNGVKVYGNMFFAPNVFGGTNAQVTNFLEQDGSGNFIAAQKMKDISTFYNFDGWFINMETDVTATNGQLMRDFVEELKTILPADQEVIWYDAMLLNGNVSWQNELNGNNSVFFQDGSTRVSDDMFINFFWSGSSQPNTSRTTAQSLGRSEFEVYTGVDLWPTRNQAPFESGGNTWMGSLFSGNQPITSLGLFVPNALFQNDSYSNFNAIDTEEERVRFYEAERHFFGGLDQNPETTDATGFRGVSNWVPATSVITNVPFETDFNTGHGRLFATDGAQIEGNWHDIAKQDILPTWQFALQGNSDLTTTFDFTKSYNGGNSLKVTGTIANTSNTKLKLYKTQLGVSTNTKIDITYSTGSVDPTYMDVFFAFSDDPGTMITRGIGSSNSEGWNIKTIDLSEFDGRELALIGFQFSSNTTVNDYSMDIGNLKIFNGPAGDENPPIANFDADRTSIQLGESVNFSSAAATNASSWSWSFTGGTPSTSTEENPTVTYNTAGIFDVELTVTNANGADTETKVAYIDVNDAPLAAFTASATDISVGDMVTFTNNSVIADSYNWSFPGGTPSTSTDENPTITYNTAGLFDVTLVATNSNGSDTLTEADLIGVTDNTDIDHTDPVGTGIITARAEINSAESKEKAFDNLYDPSGAQNVTWSKWLDNAGVPSITDPSWIQIELPEPKIARTLVLISANGAGRFPEDYAVLGSNDGINYDLLEDWENEPFIDLFVTKTLPFNNDEFYSFYRLEIYKNEADTPLTEVTEIEFRGPDLTLGTDEYSSENNQVIIYPNPASKNITLKGVFLENATLEVFNLIGQSVLQPIVLGSDNTTISIEGLSPAVYLVRITDPNGISINKKIMVK